MKTVSEIIALELKKNKINSIFMLTGLWGNVLK